MASPITWQNINGPDPKAAMLPLAVASQTLNNAFSGLKDSFNEYQTGVKDRNTNAFLDALSQYNTPEAMQQAIDSGAIAQLKQQFGNMIHQDQVRNAPSDMLQSAYERVNTQRTFEETQRKAQEAPIIDAYNQARMSGNKEAMAQIQAENPNVRWGGVLESAKKSDLAIQRDEASLAQTQTATEKLKHELDQTRKLGTKTERKDAVTNLVGQTFDQWRSDVEAGRKTPEQVSQLVRDLVPSLVTDEVPHQEATSIVDSLLGRLTWGTDGFGPEAAIKAAESQKGEAFKTWYEKNGLTAGGSLSPERDLTDLNGFIEAVAPTDHPDDVIEMRKMVAKLARREFQIGKSGTTIGAPIHVVKAAIQETADWYLSDSKWADKAMELIEERMKDTRVLEDIDARLGIEQQELNKYKLTGTLAPYNRKKEPEKK